MLLRVEIHAVECLYLDEDLGQDRIRFENFSNLVIINYYCY